MDWRARYSHMVTTFDDAVRVVNSHDRVYAGMFTSTAPDSARP
jgi:hypothetical protein